MKLYRKIISVLTAVMLTAVLMLPSVSAASVERKSVRVGFFEFEGYHMVSDAGVRSGYGYDVIQKLAASAYFGDQ